MHEKIIIGGRYYSVEDATSLDWVIEKDNSVGIVESKERALSHEFQDWLVTNKLMNRVSGRRYQEISAALAGMSDLTPTAEGLLKILWQEERGYMVDHGQLLARRDEDRSKTISLVGLKSCVYLLRRKLGKGIITHCYFNQMGRWVTNREIVAIGRNIPTEEIDEYDVGYVMNCGKHIKSKISQALEYTSYRLESASPGWSSARLIERE